MAAMLLITLVISMFAMSNAQTDLPAAIVMNPPKFTYANPGQTVRIVCAAYGSPLPTITWSKLSGNLPALLDDPTSGYKQFDQTTTVGGKQFRVSLLEICGVSEADTTDEYFCTASNGISGDGMAAASYPFFISVITDDPQEPPSIVVHPPAAADTAQYGSTVEAVCVAYGKPMPDISWSKEGCSGISCVNNAQVFSQDLSMGDVMFRKSTLQLCNIDQSNAGTFTCSADNGVAGEGTVGAKSFAWKLTVGPKPPVQSTADMVIPTTTCPDPPTAPMTTNGDRQTTVTPTVGRISDDNSSSTVYQIIAIVEGVAIVILIAGVVFGVLMIIRTRGSSQSKPIAQSTGFEYSPGDENQQHDMSYSNLVRQMGDD